MPILRAYLKLLDCFTWCLQWTAIRIMGAANWFGPHQVRIAERIDPVGVEWRRQELLGWLAQEELNKDLEARTNPFGGDAKE